MTGKYTYFNLVKMIMNHYLNHAVSVEEFGSVKYNLDCLENSDEFEPSWLDLKDFQLGLARDLFHLARN